jgi:DNA (cytosine-5)-methyltransferase 1
MIFICYKCGKEIRRLPCVDCYGEKPTLTVGSVFSGIGGLDLGLEYAGMQVIWQVEKDPFAQKILRKRFPEAALYEDVQTVTGLTKVDVLAGGFPCQDISVAGKGAGINGEQSGLWSHFARLIGELKPKFVIIENVTTLRSRGLEKVLQDLAACGYDAQWDCLPASAFGADHQRDRIFIIAYDQSLGIQGVWPERFEIPYTHEQEILSVRDSDGQWKVEPDLRREVHGVPNVLHRLRTLGNAVIPMIGYYLGNIIIQEYTKLQDR